MPPAGMPGAAGRGSLIQLYPSYVTNFVATEAPVSEGGRWYQPVGVGGNVQVNCGSGLAYGTQDGTGGFNDSIALLSGFHANQLARATIHRDPSFAPGATTRECELLLRASCPGGVAFWYECNFAWDGAYQQIVKIHDDGFTYLVGNSGGGNAGPAGGVKDGDVLEASIVGNVITVKCNGVVYSTYTDDGSVGGPALTFGSPGMGFWRGGVPSGTDTNQMYCFRGFTAVSL